jgi:DNA-binding response OmpR family regulator
MPGGNGTELLEKLRERREDIKVLMMTGYAEVEIGEASADEFMFKPFRRHELLDRVARLLTA